MGLHDIFHEDYKDFYLWKSNENSNEGLRRQFWGNFLHLLFFSNFSEVKS